MSQAYKPSAKTSPHQNRNLARDFTQGNNYSRETTSFSGLSLKIKKFAFKWRKRKLFRYIKKQVIVKEKGYG